MRIIDFDSNDYPITPVLCWTTRIEVQNERLRSRIAINRLCRAMYRQRSKQNIVPITEGGSAMRGDPTNRRELLAGWLLVVLILALVAIALRDVM